MCRTLQNLLERLRETRRKVSAKCDEFDGMVADISKEAEESVSLREKVGMTHRSLTLIEMKQEKVMREALYENGEIKKNKSSLQSQYYAEACNDWRGPSSGGILSFLQPVLSQNLFLPDFVSTSNTSTSSNAGRFAALIVFCEMVLQNRANRLNPVTGSISSRFSANTASKKHRSGGEPLATLLDLTGPGIEPLTSLTAIWATFFLEL